MTDNTNIGDNSSPDGESLIENLLDKVVNEDPKAEVEDKTNASAEVEEDQPVEEIKKYVAPANANVILKPSQEKRVLVEGLHNLGMMSVNIPSVEAQKAGFYLPEDQASALLAQHTQFGFVQVKGQPQDRSITI